MINRLLKNKRNLIIVAVLLIIAVAGTTYAWFSSRGSVDVLVLEMGRLKISADFPNASQTQVYEPGLKLKRVGKLNNLGSVPAIAKVTFTTSVTKTSDGEGNPLHASNYIVNENDSNIQFVLDESKLGYKQDDDNVLYWFKVSGRPGEYMVAMYGNISTDLTFNGVINGSAMGNDYQAALLTSSLNWDATQCLDEAMLEKFGVSFDDLIFIENDLSASGRSLSKSDVSAAKQRAAELFNR